MNGNMHGRIALEKARRGAAAGASCVLITFALCLWPFVSSSHAQSADNTNAATWYQRAIERLQALSESQREMLYNIDESGPTTEQRALITELRPVLELARRGAVQQYSDFGIDHSDGIAMMLPHIGEMRNVARLLHLDATIRLEGGDTAGAAEALATMYRMSDHLCDDRVAISSLVGQAVSSYADTLTQRALDEGKFNAADAMTLLKASMRLSPTDPFRYAEAVMAEQEMVISTVEDLVLADDAERDAAGLASDWASIQGNWGAQVPLELATMDKEALRVDLGKLDMLMDRMVESFLVEDRQRGNFEIEQLEKELERGEHGFFAKLMLPALGKLHDRMMESEEQLDQRMKSLRAIASGEVTPGEAANAALWYLRGIELLEQMPDEKREQYRAVANKPGPVVDDVARDIANAKQPIALFVEGSLMKRCDFSFARSGPERLKREYVGGMRDAARLIHADAVRLAQQNDYSAAAGRLAVAFRMSRHLGDDKALLSSLAAHEIFACTAALYDAIVAPHMDEQRTEMLRVAVERTSRKDPFGYIGAIVSDRERAVAWMYRLGATEPAQDEGATGPSPRKIAHGWDADRLLSELVLLDWLRHKPAKDIADPALNFSLIADVVSLDAISEIHVAAQTLAAMQPTVPTNEIQRATMERLFELELPAVAKVRERISDARQTVRDMHRKLRITHDAQSGEDSPDTGEAATDERVSE
jgi:hypothetical protein